MEEVSALGLEGAQEIIKHWAPFNRGETPSPHLERLYPTILWMPVEVQAEGKDEKYVVSILTYACREDPKQAVKDDILIRNRNFFQLAELVCFLLLFTSIVSLLNRSFILMCYLVGRYGHPEHDLPALRVSDLAEGCGKVAALRPVGHF